MSHVLKVCIAVSGKYKSEKSFPWKQILETLSAIDYYATATNFCPKYIKEHITNQ